MDGIHLCSSYTYTHLVPKLLTFCIFLGVHGYRARRESVTRIHSMTIEAPITKVSIVLDGNIPHSHDTDSPEHKAIITSAIHMSM